MSDRSDRFVREEQVRQRGGRRAGSRRWSSLQAGRRAKHVAVTKRLDTDTLRLHVFKPTCEGHRVSPFKYINVDYLCVCVFLLECFDMSSRA